MASEWQRVEPEKALDFVARRLRHSILAKEDRQAVAAAMEILVRRCVYPHLSPGVGILASRRLKSASSMAAAAALASELDSSRQDDCVDILDESVKLLWELAVDSSAGGELRDIVLSYHLPDLWAGLFQLNQGKGEAAQASSEKMNTLLEAVPVAYSVEALLILLAKENSPPKWLESHAGRILSWLVMREGGVVAVLERLVGNAPQGDVSVQKRVATHLAKCPKFLEKSPESYYSSVCPQVLAILSLPTLSNSAGESATQVLENLSHTALAMISEIARREAGAVEKLVVDPLVEPLLRWASGESELDKPVVESLRKLSSIVTAGDGDVKQMILRNTKEVIAPRLLLLHRSLRSDCQPNSSTGADRDRLRVAVGDLVLMHMTQACDHSLPVCWSYVMSCSAQRRPVDAVTEEISELPGRYLSEMVLDVENWELAVALRERALRKIQEMAGSEDHTLVSCLTSVCEEMAPPINYQKRELLPQEQKVESSV